MYDTYTGRNYGVDSLTGEEIELADDGYCEHGVYVGGCGADYMCGLCEDGISYAEWQEGLRYQRHQRKLRSARQREDMFLILIRGNYAQPISWLEHIALIRSLTDYPYDRA